VRRPESGFVLSAPLIHNPDFEHFLSPAIDAICYQSEHTAPAPGCRCGLYASHRARHPRMAPWTSTRYWEVLDSGRRTVDNTWQMS
jgi:hypothetical protein